MLGPSFAFRLPIAADWRWRSRGQSRISGPAHHRDRAVRAGRADRHHRAHPFDRSCRRSLGQSVIIDNRGGAAGNIGMGQVARAKPDGYTLLMTSTAIAVNTALFKNLPYDPIKDFAPISELVNAPNVLVVRPDSGITTIADLVARGEGRSPTSSTTRSPGAGTKSHLTGELLKLRAGIDMVHVPFRGAGPAAQAVLAGTVQVASVALAAGRAADQDPAICARSPSPAQRAGSRCRMCRP